MQLELKLKRTMTVIWKDPESPYDRKPIVTKSMEVFADDSKCTETTSVNTAYLYFYGMLSHGTECFPFIHAAFGSVIRFQWHLFMSDISLSVIMPYTFLRGVSGMGCVPKRCLLRGFPALSDAAMTIPETR